MLNTLSIVARDLPDAWFQCLYSIMDNGRQYVVDHGSYKGQKRLEFDYITIQVKFPGTRPLLPEIPPALGIPNPVEQGYLDNYLSYLMTPERKPQEDYTYGERLSGWTYLEQVAVTKVCCGQKVRVETKKVDQIEEVIKIYKTKGHGTNQAAMSVAIPSDILIGDPPCLRHIDTRILNDKLHFIIYFRSWDLWNGFPANLGGLQLLKEYMADEIGVQDGEIIASSKGLHIYDYTWKLAELRTFNVGKLK